MAVNDVPVKEMSLKDAVKAIKGHEDTQVKLSVLDFCDNPKKKMCLSPVNQSPPPARIG